jgi:hypothetical protein
MELEEKELKIIPVLKLFLHCFFLLPLKKQP